MKDHTKKIIDGLQEPTWSHTMPTPQEEVLERFDKQFGKSGPEVSYDSIGRMAGCDDCLINCALREEHRAFLIKELELARLDERRKIQAELLNEDKEK